MGKRFRAFTAGLKGCAEGEMLGRIDEELSLARTAGQRRHARRVASLKVFLHTGLLPRAGAGMGRKALLQLADALTARGVLSPGHAREQMITKGAIMPERKKKFSEFVAGLSGLLDLDHPHPGDVDT